MWNDSFEILDFHSHVLPEIDDGSDSLNTSIQMLEKSQGHGVDVIVATPHFYNFVCSEYDFLKRKENSLKKVTEHINMCGFNLPKIISGAEVRLYQDLWKSPDIGNLCIEGTNKILIEMPYSKWSDWMYNEIYSVTAKGYVPIMAHVERFLMFVSEKSIFDNLLSMNVIAQCNAGSFLEKHERKLIKKLIKSGKLGAIGSDCHNITERKPNLEIACKYISKKYGDDLLKMIMDKSFSLIRPQ